MRAIRILIQQNREREPFPIFAKYFPVSAVALVACLIAIILPGWLTMIAVTGTSLLYNWSLAPYEVDNGATWEWMGSAFLFFAPLVSMLTGGSLEDGLLESLIYIKVCFILLIVAI